MAEGTGRVEAEVEVEIVDAARAEEGAVAGVGPS